MGNVKILIIGGTGLISIEWQRLGENMGKELSDLN
jgi:hypothetical protein